MKHSWTSTASIVLVALLAAGVAPAQSPDIVMFSNGRLTWTNANPDLYYTVQWSGSLTNGWKSDFFALSDINATSSMITAEVPMFYRVIGDSNRVSRVRKTGLTTSYRAGDDGDYEAGQALPSPRFTDNGDGTVTDNQTGLMWTQDANLAGTSNSWTEAIDFCNALSLAGYDDWRLPNVIETLSLLDYTSGLVGPEFPGIFSNVDSPYWTSSCRSTFFGAQSYYVYEYGATVLGDWTNQYAGAVWPVRGAQ